MEVRPRLPDLALRQENQAAIVFIRICIPACVVMTGTRRVRFVLVELAFLDDRTQRWRIVSLAFGHQVNSLEGATFIVDFGVHFDRYAVKRWHVLA